MVKNDWLDEENSNFGCCRCLIILKLPTQPHSKDKILIPQRRATGAGLAYTANEDLTANIETHFTSCFCLSTQSSFVQLALRKTEFHVGETFQVDITCENSKCKYQISHFITELVKRSTFRVDTNVEQESPFDAEANTIQLEGDKNPNRTFTNEQIVMRDRSKYGCWGKKYKEFTISVKVPQFEPYSRILAQASNK